MGTQVKRPQYKSGPKGAGRITVQKSGSARVFLDGQSYDIAAEDVPESIGEWEFQAVGTAKKPIFVELSQDETRIRNVRPLEGNFFVKLVRFAAREDHLPTIYPIAEFQPEWAKWPFPAHEEFYPIVQIVNHPDYEGMESKVTLWYTFQVDEDTEEVFIPQNRSNAFANVIKFLDVTGYDLDADTLEVGEPQEILGQLEKILLSRDQIFMCQMAKGYVPFKVAEAVSLAPEGTN